MKYVALAAAVSLGMVGAIAAPSQAANLSWTVEYSGWWEGDGGGSILGSLIADESAAADGILSLDELVAWSWNWSGNDVVSAFSISSGDAGAEIQFFDGFYVDGTANLPDFADGFDQGTFIGGEFGQYVIDFETLTLEDNTTAFPFGGDASFGDATAPLGRVAVGDPARVPEPTALLGLLAIAGVGTTLKRRCATA